MITDSTDRYEKGSFGQIIFGSDLLHQCSVDPFGQRNNRSRITGKQLCGECVYLEDL